VKKYTVAGNLVRKTEANVNVQEKYKVDIELDQDSHGKALQVIQNKLIARSLRETVKGYRHWTTCAIVDVKEVEQSSSGDKELLPENIEHFSVDELTDFCVQHEIEFDAESYGNVEDARLELMTIWDRIVNPQEEENEDDDFTIDSSDEEDESEEESA
jgi:hypothetical protein